MAQDSLKQLAAQAALAYLHAKLTPGDIIGIGTGSTVNHLINGIDKLEVKCTYISSSHTSTTLLNNQGLRVEELNSVSSIDYYIDGTDEIDNKLNMIKGGGGAMTGEKILAAVSKNFLVLAHSDKFVEKLGNFPIAVEVLPMARSAVGRELVKLGANPVYREGCVSDCGNLIIDAFNFDCTIDDYLEKQLNNIPGVVENGIFCKYPASRLFLAAQDQVKEITA